MSGPVQIDSPQQLSSLLSSSRLVVVHFYDGSITASNPITPVYDQLADQLSRPNVVTFTKVNTAEQKRVAEIHNVNNPPTIMIFKNGRLLTKVNGANPQQLSEAVKRLATETSSDDTAGSTSGSAGAGSRSGDVWIGRELPRGYRDVTDQVDVRGLDLLNSDSEFGEVRTLFDSAVPSTLAIGKGKGASTGSENKKDWVESDVDEQLMLYIPFTSTVKLHTIQITSMPPSSEDDDEAPLRPKTFHLFTNRQHNLGFEEAEDIDATQTIELKASDWDEVTGTAKLELRFVKFQNVYSLVLFVVEGDGDGERTRIDRIRIIGEAGEKRDQGKLEKINDDA